MRGAPLETQAARGFAWAVFATVAGRLVSLAALAVLARLLNPTDFGLLAFALVYVSYVETMGDLGCGAALIYWPTRDEAETAAAAQVAFWVNLALAGCWASVTLALAPAVAEFFGRPEGAPVLRVLALTLPLKALGNTHDALCQKAMRFRARVGPELGQAAARAAISTALAWRGFGVWSLVWGHLFGLAVWALLQWRIVSWRPRATWSPALARPMLRYGRGIVAVNVLAAVTHHADLVVVGRMLGAAALGLYQMAARLPEMSVTVLLWVASRVVFPALARLGTQGGRLGAGYLTALRYVSLLALPVAAGLAVLAEPLVEVLFGSTWLPAAVILPPLAVFAGLRSLSTPAGDLLKAAGRSDWLARLALLRALVLVPALVVAARSGEGARIAWSLAAVTAAALVANTAFAARAAQVSPAAIARTVTPSLASAAAVGLAAFAALKMGDGQPAAIRLVAGAGAAALALTLATSALTPDAMRQALDSLAGGRAAAGGPARETLP